jgi:dodecin
MAGGPPVQGLPSRRGIGWRRGRARAAASATGTAFTGSRPCPDRPLSATITRPNAGGRQVRRRQARAGVDRRSSQGAALSVYRVIDVIGTSTQSWEDAATTAVNTARQSLRDLRVAEVVAQDLSLGDDGGYLPHQAAAAVQGRDRVVEPVRPTVQAGRCRDWPRRAAHRWTTPRRGRQPAVRCITEPNRLCRREVGVLVEVGGVSLNTLGSRL